VPYSPVGPLVLLLDTGGGGIIPRGTRVEVFSRIFDVFLLLGTLVGVVVIGYMSWKAYKYRDRPGEADDTDVDRPRVGELPQGSGGGRKLFVSFTLSAVIVLSLILWTYGTLLYVERATTVEDASAAALSDGAAAERVQVESETTLRIEVIGTQFDWTFVYPNGHRTDVLRAPVDTEVQLLVTSGDVFHNFGIPGLRVKADAIPGQTTDTWFVADEPGTHRAHCYELCGAGHSYMNAEVVILEQAAYEEWYADTGSSNASMAGGANASDATAAAVRGGVVT
jgi:cytochrome c oxidase subunit 2